MLLLFSNDLESKTLTLEIMHDLLEIILMFLMVLVK
jgi:hypothetical protein